MVVLPSLNYRDVPRRPWPMTMPIRSVSSKTTPLSHVRVGMIYGHCHSLLLVIIKRTSLVTEFNEVCLSLFDGAYINPNVDLQYWKGWYIHYFFFLPNEKLFDLPPPLNFKFRVCSLKDACSEGTNITDELQYIMARFSNFGKIIMRHLVKGRLAVSGKTPVCYQLRVRSWVTVFDLLKILASIWIYATNTSVKWQLRLKWVPGYHSKLAKIWFKYTTILQTYYNTKKF